MSNPQLHNKTIRPGSLSGYSYYYSNRQAPAQPMPKAKTRRRVPSAVKKLALTVAVVAALIAVPMLISGSTSNSQLSSSQGSSSAPATAAINAPEEVTPKQPDVNHCAGNVEPKFIKISVSQRHLWACEGEKEVHDSPVITGMLMLPETLTPPGNYQIYAKQMNTTLSGSDSAGSWRYPVHHWMPFLDNQYGTYGFHDATWRPDSDFGNIDPNTKDASHGCIELTLGSAAWLYNWAPVKTPLTVES